MNQPDSYLKLTGEFFHAIEGLPDDVGLGYLRLIWHCRHHNHCRGLEDNDDFLRKVARVEKERWPEVKKILFDNDFFFTLDENGLWYQKRTWEDFSEDKKRLEKFIQRGRAGAAGRWQNKVNGHAKKIPVGRKVQS